VRVSATLLNKRNSVQYFIPELFACLFEMLIFVLEVLVNLLYSDQLPHQANEVWIMDGVSSPIVKLAYFSD
jgi:hypothetical protein